MVDVGSLTDKERSLLERLAVEGKATSLIADDLELALSLEADRLLFFVRDPAGGASACAVISPRGRRLLAEFDRKPPKPPMPPFRFKD
jgi:hypothetical protein